MRFIPLLAIVLFHGFIALGLFLRIQIAENALGYYTDCSKCYSTLVIRYDAWLIAVMLLAAYLSFCIPQKLASYSLRFVSLVILCGYYIDIYVTKTLSHRFNWEDVRLYGQWDNLVSFFHQPFPLLRVIISVGIFLWVLAFILLPSNGKYSFIATLRRYCLFAFLSSLLLFTAYSQKRDYLVVDAVHNYIYNIFFFGEKAEISELLIQKYSPHRIADYEHQQCRNDGLGQRKNIILVVVESLSAYQSQLMMGGNNWTPYLDQLARENMYFPNFFANSFASSFGRAALLTGEVPIYPYPLKITDYRNTKYSLPRTLHLLGYHSAVLAAGGLEFLGNGLQFEAMGFDYVEGDDYIGYKDEKRYSFNAVPDEVLYQRTINYIEQQTTPYFLTLITVSSHAPYVTPDNEKGSIENAIKYADKSLFYFYQQLKQNNFFDNGVLFITSDHRAMVPTSAAEEQALGVYAKSRIPLIVIDGEKQFTDERFLQQADLPTSIGYLVNDSYCFRQHEHNLFKSVNPDACVYHVNGFSRNEVEVFCQNGIEFGIIRLEGDNSFVKSGNLAEPKEHLDWVNANRVNALLRGKEYLKQKKD